ncbi:MAG: PSD1 and planctomycete cytochrome C domain-containing protein [Opitutia bacterium]
MPFLRLLTLGAAVSALHAADPAGEPKFSSADLEFYERQIRPILADRCYECHSKDKGVSKGGLILDSRGGMLAGGDQGPAVVPGDIKKSLLIVAVHQKDPELSMPPRKNGNKLGGAQIDLLERWIKMGAPAPAGGAVKLTGLSDKARAHWAFQAVTRPEVPAKLSVPAWAQNEVDAFVLARLDQAGLRPSPAADGEALLRRLQYDLVGLPPSNAEVEAFAREYDLAVLRDNMALRNGQPARSATAVVERAVDRLLASPHYGERWGRHWLDTARYSDSKGLRQNGVIERFEHSWTYRDYVIGAFNTDKPYDQFIIEQLAADKLPGVQADDPRLAALGFITVGKRFQNNDDLIDERIDATTKGFLGLTVACARCHDHKFDPIPASDYYSLHGVFASVLEPLDGPTIRDPISSGRAMPATSDRADYEKKLADLVDANTRGYYTYIGRQVKTLHKDFAGRLLAAYHGVRSPEAFDASQKYKFEIIREVEGSISVRPDSPITAPLAALKKIPASEFPARAPKAIAEALANDRVKVNPLVAAALKGLRPRSIDDVAEAYQEVFQRHADRIQAHIRLRGEPGRRGAKDDPALAQLAAFPWALPDYEEISTTQTLTLACSTRQFCEPWQDKINFRNNVKPANIFKFEAISQLDITHPGGPGRAMVVTDAEKPRDSYGYIRGDRNKRGPVAPRQFLEVLAGPEREPFYEGSGRRELALAIASRTNPLTSRVLVNRVWMHHFGTGIVTTADDFGNMADQPTHPELLDWLATWFMDNGWSIKKLHRKILLSAAYRQTANPSLNPLVVAKGSVDPMKVDGGNRLLWHANLRRLDFEAIRDSMLALTGKLDRTMGGKPVNITDEPYSYRRSVYGYIDRDRLSEMQAQFDFADPSMPNSKRLSSIVPQQALFFMNNPLSIEVARSVSARPEIVKAGGDTERIVQLYKIMYQRTPTADELRIAREFVIRIVGYIDDPEPERPGRSGKVSKASKTVAEAPKGSPEANIKTVVQGGVIQNKGEKVSRKQPISPWEMLVQSMVCSNEFVYLN